MTLSPHPDREKLIRQGFVYIAWDEGRSLYSYHWELTDPPTFVEQGPDSSDMQEAIRWGRRRTSNIIVRPEEDPNVAYWAGTGPSPDPEVPPYVPPQD